MNTYVIIFSTKNIIAASGINVHFQLLVSTRRESNDVHTVNIPAFDSVNNVRMGTPKGLEGRLILKP